MQPLNKINLFGSTQESKVIIRLEVMLVILFSEREKEENNAERTEKKINAKGEKIPLTSSLYAFLHMG